MLNEKESRMLTIELAVSGLLIVYRKLTRIRIEIEITYRFLLTKIYIDSKIE